VGRGSAGLTTVQPVRGDSQLNPEVARGIHAIDVRFVVIHSASEHASTLILERVGGSRGMTRGGVPRESRSFRTSVSLQIRSMMSGLNARFDD